ncbi:hypothetical protein [Amycolatopsis sp. NPDC001319]|uniref:hypothetical protein n=1 Tax=unclassified Amycolatopsis TaxID=2618356 RepID=UPI0036B666E9
MSLDDPAHPEHRTMPEQLVEALAETDLQLLSSIEPQSHNPAERLRQGESLYVASVDRHRTTDGQAFF